MAKGSKAIGRMIAHARATGEQSRVVVSHPSDGERKLRWERGYSGDFHTPTEMFVWRMDGSLIYNYELPSAVGNDGVMRSKSLGKFSTLEKASVVAFKQLDKNRAAYAKRLNRGR